MRKRWGLDDIAKLNLPTAANLTGKPTSGKVVRPSKYSNKKVLYNGIKFDSQREATDYGGLLILERQGMITELKRQQYFELNIGGTFSYKYKADFTYMQDGKLIVQDSKGFKTKEFKKKMKLMKKVHGIDILLT